MIVTIKRIYCIRTRGEINEEPYLKVTFPDGDEVWGPTKMWRGTTEPIRIQIDCPSPGSVTLNLYESDTAGMGMSSLDPHVDDYTIEQSHERGSFDRFFPQGAEMRGGDSGRVYRIYYDVTDDLNEPVKPYLLHLTSLECRDAQEATDEVYFVVDGRRVGGTYNMKSGRTVPLNIDPIPIDRVADISLWEYDGWYNDRLGGHTFTVNDDLRPDDNTHTFRWRKDAVRDARYILHYRVSLNVAGVGVYGTAEYYHTGDD